MLTAVVIGPTHPMLISMQGVLQHRRSGSWQAIGTYGKTLKAIDASIESAAKQVSDGNNISLFVNTTKNPKVSRMLGM